MGKIIDERIVAMKFDNSQFESAVKKTMNTLTKFKSALNLDGAIKSINSIEKAVTGISFKGVAAGVEALSDRFSTLGIVGMRVVERLTDSMINLAEKGIRYLTDSIVSGGITRAMNIENARFQLQALLKDEEKVNSVMQSALDSVDGTAYAYDLAAKAASMFAASNVQTGEQMDNALRAIANATAAVNGNYSSMAQIFTKVSGQGRVLGKELLQLSVQGMNAAALIANYLRDVEGMASITEAKVRELVSESQINFDILVNSMNYAFDGAAKRANETINGAFANVRAALARIGAGFVSPLVEQNSKVVLLLNSMRLAINKIKKELVFDEELGNVNALSKQFSDTVLRLAESASIMIDNMDIRTPIKVFINSIDAAKNAVKAFDSILKPISKSFKETFLQMSGLNILNISYRFKNLTESMKLSDSASKKLYDTFNLLFTTMKPYVNLLKNQLTKALFKVSEKIGDFFMKLDTTKVVKVFENSIIILNNLLMALFSILKPLGKALGEFVSELSLLDILVSISTKVREFTHRLTLTDDQAESLYEKFKKFLEVIKNFGKAVGTVFIKAVKLMSNAIQFFVSNFDSEKTFEIFRKSIRSVINVAKALLTVVSPVARAVQRILVISPLSDILLGIATKIEKLTSMLILNKGAIAGVYKSIVSIFNILKPLVKGIASQLFNILVLLIKQFQKFAASMDIVKVVKAFTNILYGINNVFKFLLKVIRPVINAFKDFMGQTTLVGTIEKLTDRFRSLTASLKISGKVTDAIYKTFKFLFRLMGRAITGTIRVLTKAFDTVAEVIETLFNNLDLDKVFKAFENGIEAIINVIEALGNILGPVIKMITNFASKISISDILLKVSEKILDVSRSFGSLNVAVDHIVNLFSKLVDSIKPFVAKYGPQAVKVFDKILKTVERFVINLDISKIVKVFENSLITIENIAKTFWTVFESLGSAVSKFVKNLNMGDLIIRLSDKFKSFTESIQISKDGAKRLSDIFYGILGVFQKIGGGLFGQVAKVFGVVVNLIKEFIANLNERNVFKIFENVIDGITNVFKGLYSIIKPVFAAFRDTFLKGDLTQTLLNISEAFKNITEKMIISGKTSDNIYDTFKGLFDLAKLFIDAIKGIIEILSPFGFVISGILRGIIALTGWVGRVISSFTEWINTSPRVAKAYEFVKKAIENLANFIRYTLIPFIVNAKDAFIDFIHNASSGEFKFPGLDLLSALLKRIKDRIVDIGSSLTNSKLAEKFGVIKGSIGDKTKGLQPVLEKLSGAFKKVTSVIGPKFSKVFDALVDKLANTDFNHILDVINAITIFIAGTKLNKWLTNLNTQTQNFSQTLSILKPQLSANGSITFNLFPLQELKNVLIAYQKDIEAKTLMTIAKAILILVAACVILALIDTTKLSQAIVVIYVLFEKLAGIFKMVGKYGSVKSGKQSFAQIGTAMVLIAVAVLILAGAVNKLASIEDPVKMFVGLLAVVVMLQALVKVLDKIQGKQSIYLKGVLAVVIIAEAVKIMCKGLAILAEQDAGSIFTAMIAIIVLLAVLMKFMKNANSTQTGLLPAAISMIVLAESVKRLAKACIEFAQLSWDKLKVGLVGLAVTLGILALAIRFMPKNAPSIGLSLVLFCMSLKKIVKILKMFADMNVNDLKKSLISFAVSLGVLALALHFMKGTIEGAAAMMVASIALGILGVALKIFNGIKISAIVKGLGALAGMFIVFGVAAFILEPVIGVMLALGGAMMLIAGSVAVLGLGMVLLGAGLVSLSAGFTAIAGSLSVVMAALMKAAKSIIKTLTEIAKLIIAALFDIVRDICQKMIDDIPTYLETAKKIIGAILTLLEDYGPRLIAVVVKLVTVLLEELSKYMPRIANAVIDIIIKLINTLAERIPDLLGAITNFIASLLGAILDVIKSIDTGNLVNTLEAIGLIAAISYACAGLAALAPAALAGVLAMGGVIAELTALLVAIGALEQIPGLQWLVEQGGELLQAIGEAIGKFIGGLIGGVIGSASKGVMIALGNLGQGLNDFITNAGPFFEKMQSIDKRTLDGITHMSAGILLLTGAEFIDSISRFVNKFLGGSGGGLGYLGSELKSFADNATPFFEAASKLNADSSKGVKYLAEAILMLTASDMIDGLANFYGLKDKNTLTNFGEQLSAFAPSLVEYADQVKDINADSVRGSAEAATMLADLNNKLPSEDGALQWWAGHKDWGTFTEGIKKVAPALVEFGDKVKDLDSSGIEGALKVANGLSGVASSLEAQDGLWQKLVGEKKLSTFATGVGHLGRALKSFNKNVADIDTNKVYFAKVATYVLGQTAQSIPIPDNKHYTLDAFAQKIVTFGEKLKAYYDEIKSVDQNKMAAVIALTMQMADLLKTASGIDSTKVKAFIECLSNIGDAGVQAFIDAFGTSGTTKTHEAVSSYVEDAANIASSNTEGFKNVGIKAVSKFQTGFQNPALTFTSIAVGIMNDLIDAVTLKSDGLVQLGKAVAIGFGNEIYAGKEIVKDAGRSLARQIVNAIGEEMIGIDGKGPFYAMGDRAVTGFINGMNSRMQSAIKAAKALGEACYQATKKQLDIHSPSRKMGELGNYAGLGFVDYLMKTVTKAYEAGKDLGNSAVDGVNRAVGNVSKVFYADLDTNPVITPLVDLSNVEDSAASITDMFNSSIAKTKLSALSLNGSVINPELKKSSEYSKSLDILGDALGKLGDINNDPTVINNEFNITSNDPEEVANVVSERIQASFERREAVWE